MVDAAHQRLAPRLEKLKEKILLDMPPGMKKKIADYLDYLNRAGGELLAGAVRTGQRAPDFMLKNIDNFDVSLQEELKKGPVVLCYYRGEWCPFCQEELKALQEIYPRIRQLGAELISVSPQNEEYTRSTASKLALTYQVLRDPGASLSDLYGLTIAIDEPMREAFNEMGLRLEEYNDDLSYKLPVPAAYVIRPDGMIIYDFIDADYTRRVEPQMILDKLKEVVP
ncbi:MAG: AhpC/TSA family protein [Nitrospinota bacterium]|nr:AhpC/TSA family protein [Nitrospinota bacterium]